NLPGMEETFDVSNLLQIYSMNYDGTGNNPPGDITVVIDDTSAAWLATIDTPFIFGIGHIGTHLALGTVTEYENDYNELAVLPDNYYPYTVDYPSFLYADTLS